MKSYCVTSVKYYTKAMNDHAQQRLRLDNAMHSALQDNELSMVLQPIVSAQEGRVCGAEALMRWESATVGHVSPAVFIPIAEENGLIAEMGEWILYQACQMARKMPEDFFVTVNVSTVQFRKPGFVQVVQGALIESGLAASRLHLEVTEAVLVDDSEDIDQIIQHLANLGVILAIDDFGTGYSSLAYLTRFPCSVIRRQLP